MTEVTSQPPIHPPIRVFLVDDHEVVRDGLRALLEAQPDMVVVGEAGGAIEALRHIPPMNPDVAVVDVNLPDGDGVQVCRELRDRLPELRSLILTSYADDEALLDAIMAGAAGYVLKQVRSSDLVSCIRRVAAGESLLSPALRARVAERLRAGADQDPRLAALTGQERRILDLLGEGLTNREIAARMHLAEKTVKNYVSNLLMKMGMARRTEAAAFAARVAERRHQRSARPGDGVDPIRY
jgi:DNA-binding NarL/FixJ family response regulator